MTDDFEKELRQLDEALRFSAKANGWLEPDKSVEGLLPEDEIQSTGDLEADFKLDELPDGMRFLGWARYDLTDDEITVDGPGGSIGPWPRSVWDELIHRYREAG